MASPIDATLVIRGGTIVDGTGAPPFVGDVAVSGETICAIGQNLDVTGAPREIDARGLMVTPGWIDPHTHYDGQATWDPLLSPSTHNGVTTCIMGNCGVGFAPCQKELRGFIVELMEAVEDIPGTALVEGIQWEWETFPEYLDTLAKKEFACDVAVILGHAGVRTWVLGRRANLSDRPGGPEKDPVTPEEIEAMSAVVKEAVSAGALGFSTSRLLLHRDKFGILTPGCLASTQELVSIGRAVAEGGGGCFEMSSDFTTYDDIPYHKMEKKRRAEFLKGEFSWIEQVAEENGSNITFSWGGSPESHLGFKKQGLVNKVKSTGAGMWLQFQTRPQSIHMSLASGTHPFKYSPTFMSLESEAGDDLSKLTSELSKPATKAAILEDMSLFKMYKEKQTITTQGMEKAFWLKNAAGVVIPSWMVRCDGVTPWTETYEPFLDASVDQVAKRAGRTPLDVCYDLLLDVEGPHRGCISRHLFGYTGDNSKIRKLLMEEDFVMPGFDDAGAHCTILTDATAPTHLLCYYCRDRTRGELIPVERAVQMQSSIPAECFGLHDRGVLQPGKRADINVIDFDNVKIKPPQWARDLPTGAGRWVQGVEGYKWTLTRGVVTFENDQHTGALPGRLVRNPKRAGLQAGSGIAAATANEVEDNFDVDQKEHALMVSQAEGAGLSAIARTLRESNQSAKDASARSRL